ncbi:Helix-turn-helix domain-containing protein [Cupriavidus sp. H19C3]|uniref:helix-turn-helix transcriptional regulator n=1 Tax=Cupriavidus sp. H19C3 TaxID=3241603 RepID=UPI003BF79084
MTARPGSLGFETATSATSATSAASASSIEDDLPPDSRSLELGAFLRARREGLDPARAGLARVGRRRTPGLRREEVAALADIGITWYTKLEQGRPIRVSARVLNAVASALQCSESETEHLFNLAGMTRPAEARPPCEAVSAATQRILDQLYPLPAVVENARFDILGFNDAYCRLIGVNLANLPPADRNCIYLGLTQPAWKSIVVDWHGMVATQVALFRAGMAEHMQDPVWQAHLQRFMMASETFGELWQRYQVSRVENHVNRFFHAETGVLTMQTNNWWSAPRNGVRMLVYVPTDAQSEAGLLKLPEV